MKSLLRRSVWLQLVAITVAFSGVPQALAQDANSPAGNALESIFNPQRSPANKSMGLLQRSFLDLVETSQPQMQIALVVDGTDSMAADIEGVRKALSDMVADLHRYKGENVSFALVVYRDFGAVSGELSIPQTAFSSDVNQLQGVFATIKPESGAPYFPELVDLGVHAALTQLDWSSGEDTTRAILLFGDAPPYDPGFDDSQNKTPARRRYETDILVNIAKTKGIKINCVLCTSNFQAYEKVLDKTRGFMNKLATDTGGLMLDLSYADIRDAIANAAQKPRVQYQKLAEITRSQVELVRVEAQQKKSIVDQSQRIRVAILPHLPLDKMDFHPDLPQVQIAAELRYKFREISRIEVKSPVLVQRELKRLVESGIAQDQLLQMLALKLRVDYVVWGGFSFDTTGSLQVTSAIYEKNKGDKITETTLNAGHVAMMLASAQVSGRLADELMTATLRRTDVAPELVAAFRSARSNEPLRKGIIMPVAVVVPARSDLLAGFEALEQALAQPVESSEGRSRLLEAEASLKKVVEREPANAFAHWLLANCYFNSAQYYQLRKMEDRRVQNINQFLEAIKLAYRNRNTLELENVKTEIEADYNLLVRAGDASISKAIDLYESLTKEDADNKLHSALRAHWMLAGIYSGDWGVDARFANGEKARDHIIQILAHWPDSNESQFVKTNLRWNEEKGRSEFAHFPRQNSVVLQ